jgi:hypothetical protein
LLFVGPAFFLFLHARLVAILLVHLHNVMALLVWLVMFRRRPGWAIVPLVLVVGFAAVLLSGAYLPWTLDHGGSLAFGVRVETLGAWLAPGVRPGLGVGLAMTFVFLQGVHYAAWTGWIPQDDLPNERTPTYRMSVRALLADFGPITLGLVGIGALAFAVFAVGWDIHRSFTWYMTLAKSHAWFEFAFFAYFLASGGHRQPTNS